MKEEIDRLRGEIEQNSLGSPYVTVTRKDLMTLIEMIEKLMKAAEC